MKILEIKNLTIVNKNTNQILLDNISFILDKGSTLGIVGESGSGKTTLAQAILKLVPADGIINYKNKVFDKNNNAFFRRNIQFVFQDPFSSLSPRLSIYEIISEVFRIYSRILSSKKPFLVL